jgi:hypothetical protein
MFGWTFHHEGWDWEDEDVYQRYVSQHAMLVETFDAGGGVMTSEVRDEYVQELRSHRSTLVSDLLAGGHNVGTHADLGGNPNARNFDQETFARRLTMFRENLEALNAQVSHVSGVCSDLDWVTATREAGFMATTGGVAYCLSSLPRDQRPDPFKDCENAGACHQPWPSELARRISPWRMKDGSNWTEHDPTGEVIYIPSSGTLRCFAEREANPEESLTQCDAAQNDVDAFLRDLDAAIAARTADGVHTYYVVWSMGETPDAGLLESFLEGVQVRVDDGQVEWATIPQMIAAYETAE